MGLIAEAAWIAEGILIAEGDNKMIDRIDEQPTPETDRNFRLINVFDNRRKGKDRRRGNSVIDPQLDRRKGERRKSKRGT